MTEMVTKQQLYFNFSGKITLRKSTITFIYRIVDGKCNCALYAIIHRSNEQPTEFENRVTWLKSNLNMMNIYKVNWHQFLDVTVIQWMGGQLSSHRIVFFKTNRNKKKFRDELWLINQLIFLLYLPKILWEFSEWSLVSFHTMGKILVFWKRS
jgi:hypothetical protein